MDPLGELPSFVHVRSRRFAPYQVGVGGIGQTSGDRLIQALPHHVEPLHRPLAGQKLMIARIDVARQQAGCQGVGAGDDQRWHVQHVGGQPGGDQFGDGLLGRHQHFASHVTALFGRRQLVLEMHGGRPGLDHGLHQFESIEHAAEARLGIGHNGRVPIGHLLADPRAVRDLVGPLQGVVDPPHQRRHAVDGIETLIGIRLLRAVHVAGHLPTADINGLQSGLHHLHGLSPRLRPRARI